MKNPLVLRVVFFIVVMTFGLLAKHTSGEVLLTCGIIGLVMPQLFLWALPKSK